MQEKNSTHVELSEVWLELLGESSQANVEANANEESIPTLESDPWSHLLHEQGAEIVNLRHATLHMSDQEVEQLLQQLQDQKEQR